MVQHFGTRPFIDIYKLAVYLQYLCLLIYMSHRRKKLSHFWKSFSALGEITHMCAICFAYFMSESHLHVYMVPIKSCIFEVNTVKFRVILYFVPTSKILSLFSENISGTKKLCEEIVFEVEANFDSYQKLFFLVQFSRDPRSKTNSTYLDWIWPHRQ